MEATEVTDKSALPRLKGPRALVDWRNLIRAQSLDSLELVVLHLIQVSNRADLMD